MSYGPGYVLWKQILRERAERRAERITARRAPPKDAATADAPQPAAGAPPTRRARRRPTAGTPVTAASER